MREDIVGVTMRAPGTSRRKVTVAIACLACLCMVLSSSGCLDVYGTKSIFGAKPPAGKPVYKDRTKGEISHKFETSITDPTTWNFARSNSTRIGRDSEWLKVLIDISILDIPIPIPNVTIPERYVRIEIVMADGSKWIDSKYTSTAHDEVLAINPIDGIWSIYVSATGLGFSQAGYQDSLRVILTAREPI